MGFFNVADTGERCKTELWDGSQWSCSWTLAKAELGQPQGLSNPSSFGLVLGTFLDGESILLVCLCSSPSLLCWPAQEPQDGLLTALWSVFAKQQQRMI